MKSFGYERAAAPQDAARAGAAQGASFIAGGTNLLDLMKLEVVTPSHLVDLGRLPPDGVRPLADGGVRIGAGLSNSALAADTIIRRRYPLLSQALLAGASPQLRNTATTAGNLLQRTRCVYFLRYGKALQQTRPWQRLLGPAGVQPDERRDWRQRGLHRGASVRHGGRHDGT